LANALGEGDATLGAIATKVKMSERTLQRKLEAKSQIFDSDPSPFHRAFRR